MLTLPSSVRVYIAAAPIDLRRGHDGLVAIVRSTWCLDPFGGHLFVFLGRRLDRVKILVWDRNGFVLYYKRLSQGRFRMPNIASGAAAPKRQFRYCKPSGPSNRRPRREPAARFAFVGDKATRCGRTAPLRVGPPPVEHFRHVNENPKLESERVTVVAVRSRDEDRVPSILPDRACEGGVTARKRAGCALAVHPDVTIGRVVLGLDQVVADLVDELEVLSEDLAERNGDTMTFRAAAVELGAVLFDIVLGAAANEPLKLLL
jgi:transposase